MSQPVVLARLIQARLLVGALGEALGWWPSKFTSAAGRRSLNLVLPRSWPRAVLESVTLAARLHHDRAVPNDAVHLFRLGTAHEDAIAHQLTAGQASLVMPHDGPDEIARALDAFGARAPATTSPGPVLIGPPARLREHATIDALVGMYAWAASAAVQSVPYFREGP